MEDAEEPAVFLIALGCIVRARGGLAKTAKAAVIDRESLYRALSARENPWVSTPVAVTKAGRFKATIEIAH